MSLVVWEEVVCTISALAWRKWGNHEKHHSGRCSPGGNSV